VRRDTGRGRAMEPVRRDTGRGPVMEPVRRDTGRGRAISPVPGVPPSQVAAPPGGPGLQDQGVASIGEPEMMPGMASLGATMPPPSAAPPSALGTPAPQYLQPPRPTTPQPAHAGPSLRPSSPLPIHPAPGQPVMPSAPPPGVPAAPPLPPGGSGRVAMPAGPAAAAPQRAPAMASPLRRPESTPFGVSGELLTSAPQSPEAATVMRSADDLGLDGYGAEADDLYEKTVVSAASELLAKATESESPDMAAIARREEEAHFREVYAQFVDTKKQCGESLEGMGFDRFLQRLIKTKADLVSKYGCQTVRFSAYVKSGKAALKATPIK